MNTLLALLAVGLLLGIKHAFEADHLIAVTNMVSHHKHPLKAALIGTFWGAGHTLTLLVCGILVLIFKLQISNQLGKIFEISVGVMLIVLGLFNLFKKHDEQHAHQHSHGPLKHSHSHSLNSHHKSFLVGVVHGLDGSGALMLLVLSTIHSTVQGLFYILVFGTGSIIGMSGISMALGAPLAYGSKKMPSLNRTLQVLTGLVGVIFGLYIVFTAIF